MFYLPAYGRLFNIGERVNPQRATHPWHCHYICTGLHFFLMSQCLYFVFFTGLNEVSRITFKKKKKPNSEGNFQNQVIFFHPAKHPSTSVVSLGRVQPGTELVGEASQEHRRPKTGER